MIEVAQLTKAYGPRTAIHQLSFSVQPGEIVGFLGPNGAGKSTTMKILTGFMPATSGEAKVAGYDVFQQPLMVKKNVGYLPENPPVYLEMVVQEYLLFAAQIHDLSGKEANKAVQDVLEKTSLGSVRNRMIGNLSKGYRQRVGLAQALVHNPKVLILDEPTVGLDPAQIIDIRKLIKSLGGDHTVILSSHILPEVTATCQRVIIINQGQIVAQDSLSGLTARMNKGQIFQMTVRHPSAQGATAIRGVPGVTSANLNGDKISIQIDSDRGEIRDQVVEVAVREKLGVLEFSSEKVSLEDVFLKLTTKEELN